jgi:hypothetical protein
VTELTPSEEAVDEDFLCDDSMRRRNQRSNETTASTLTSDHERTSRLGEMKRQLLDVLGICLYFVSMDCTLSDKSCFAQSSSITGDMTFSVAAKIARRIRHTLLTHDSGVHGILHLLLIIQDPLTLFLRKSRDKRQCVY